MESRCVDHRRHLRKKLELGSILEDDCREVDGR